MFKLKLQRLALTVLAFLSLVVTACGNTPSVTPGPAVIFTTTNSVTSPATATTQPITSTTAVTTTVSASGSPAAASPNGKIAFDSQDGQIFLINPDGTGQTRLTSGKAPLFAPDGKRVAFVVSEGQALGNPPLKETISSVGLDGGSKQDYCGAKTNYSIGLVSWSSRGKFIAFRATQANANGQSEVYLCTVATKKAADEPIKVIQGTVTTAYDWSPPGDYALWQSGKDDFNLYYGDPDLGGKGATNLSNSQNRGDQKRYEGAAFSPDGKTIAIVGSKIFFVNVPGQKSPFEGKTLDTLTGATGLAWSPDSKQLAVVIGGPNARSLVLVNLADGKTTTLADKVGGGVDWSKP